MVAFPARRWRSNPVPRELPPATAPYGHFIELELHGEGNGWTSVKPDLLVSPSIKLSYGISGAGPSSLVASTGTLGFALNNSEANSAGLLGYYSTENGNCRAGFRRGIGVRYRYRVPGTYRYYTKHVGRLLAADPISGQYGERRTLCDSADWMNEAASIPVNIPVQLNVRADQLVAAIVAAVPRQPNFTSFDVADSTFPYAPAITGGSGGSALTELQRAMQSEFGRFYLRGTLNQNGMIARLERRSARLVPLPVAAFIGTMQGLKPTASIRNRARVTAHPRRVDPAATTVLYSKPNTSNPAVAPGQTIKLTGRYTDPSNPSTRVSGVEMQALVSGTDYQMTANADGTGADLTASFSVLVEFVASQANYLVTNNGGVLGYVIKLRAIGKGLYDYDPLIAEDFDQASIDIIGESEIALDMPYQADVAVAAAVAEFLVDTWLTPGASGASLKFIPRDDEEMEIAMSLEPGDPISVSELVTGVNGVYFIQQASITVEDVDVNTVFEWGLQRALVQDYWTLGVAGFSELGISTVLAPL